MDDTVSDGDVAIGGVASRHLVRPVLKGEAVNTTDCGDRVGNYSKCAVFLLTIGPGLLLFKKVLDPFCSFHLSKRFF